MTQAVLMSGMTGDGGPQAMMEMASPMSALYRGCGTDKMCGIEGGRTKSSALRLENPSLARQQESIT